MLYIYIYIQFALNSVPIVCFVREKGPTKVERAHTRSMRLQHGVAPLFGLDGNPGSLKIKGLAL